jgi:hypothetical protein
VHPALWHLNRLKLRGVLRKAVRGLKTWRGVVVSLFAVAMFAMFVVPNLLIATQLGRTDPDVVRSIAPVAMFGLCVLALLTTSAEKAVNFTLAEVDFLFPGPFTRRELLLYKIQASGTAALFTALIFSFVFLRWASWWIAGFVGIWLVLMFNQLLGMALALIAQWIGEQAYTRARRALLAAAIGLAAFVLWQAIPAGKGFSWDGFVEQFRSSTIGQALVLPFEPFGRTIASETLGEFALWGVAATALTLLLLAVVLQLDANYLEAAAVASQKRYDIQQRARQGRMPAMGARHTARWRLPALPWLGGAGPIAWRQATQLARSSPRLLLLLLIVSLSAGPGFLTIRTDAADLTGPVIGMVAWLTFFITATVPTGFRADLDYMDWLKMLPVRPLAIVIGELAPGVMFITLLQVLLFAGLSIFAPTSGPLLLAAACFAVPVNMLFLTADNMLFLWFPSRTVATSPGDLQFMGRQMLMVVLRMLVVMVAAALAVVPSLLVWVAGVESLPVLAGIAWLVLTAEGIALNFGTLLAFQSFDPSVDMPA